MKGRGRGPRSGGASERARAIRSPSLGLARTGLGGGFNQEHSFKYKVDGGRTSVNAS